ncbi:forkhead box protein N1 [Gastrophryne carolinensis]
MEAEKDSYSQLDGKMVNLQTGCLHSQNLVEPSMMQDQPSMAFTPGSVDSDCSPINPSDDGLHNENSSLASCLPMDNYRGQTNDSEIPERKTSDSSMSPDLPLSPNDQISMRFPSKTSPHRGYRRYSCDEPIENSYAKHAKGNQHPYKRQFSDVFPEALNSLSLGEKTFKGMDGIDSFGPSCPEDAELFTTHIPDISAEAAWCNSLQFSSGHDEGSQMMLGLDTKLKPQPLTMRQEEKEKMHWSQSPAQQLYCTPQTFPQYSAGGSYPVTYISASHYPYQRIAPQAGMEPQQPLYPKPIYSYSILIFMALKSSKTGSLPVSEIYNFMTEHFPYFKTAPDGWKNSVRHNLSLNKCFEKVENKTGSSSRKGCLWALNPAKIDKMQEELQKWKRKDPVTVRKSMAKPEDLDKLIGERTEKLRSTLLACNASNILNTSAPIQLSMQTHEQNMHSSLPTTLQSMHNISESMHAKKQLPCYNSLQHDYPQISPAMLQQRQRHSMSQNYFSSSDHQGELNNQPINPQDSPIPAHTPPLHNMKMAEHSPTRTMRDHLIEGELSTDIDALNPSLTDFELQGHLWEELKDDSLNLDPINHPINLISPSPTPPAPQYFLHNVNCESNNNDISSPHSNSHMGLGSIHLTSVYSSFMEMDNAVSSYISSSGSKHVAIV